MWLFTTQKATYCNLGKMIRNNKSFNSKPKDMKKLLTTIILAAACLAPAMAQQQAAKPTDKGERLVRLAKITVDPERLSEYNAYLKEGAEAAMSLEPGVIKIYAVAEKDTPHKITILEIYADRAAYESHLKTTHFMKYKQGTLDMVEDLQLIDVKPLF